MSDPIFNLLGLPGVGSSATPTFVDIDSDGDLDAFIGNHDGNTLFFQNTGTTSNPIFAAPIINPFGLTNVNASAVPSFVDIDGDGDLDAFISGRNSSILFLENTGTTSSAAFTAGSANPFSLLDLGDVGYFSNATFVDIDGDGDLDAFTGAFSGNTLFFKNIGTISSAQFAAPETNPFGLSNVGLHSNPTLVDIDGDSDLDALIGNNDGNTLFYRNTGTTSNPAFAAPIINPFGLSDVGRKSASSFIDIDGDGDLDAFVGELWGSTVFARNTGTASSAAFAAGSTNPFGLSDVGDSASLTFVDIDGDGDLDALIGSYDGNTYFFINDSIIANTNNPPTGSTYINDTTPELEQILTASNDLVDADGLGAITYQWKAGDSIVGVGETHTVTADEIGKTITVTASYTDGLGKLESVSSAATEVVTEPPLLKANDIFEAAGRIGGDGTDTGILDTGMIRVMADFSKAAYDLQDWENEQINDRSPNADSAKNTVVDLQGWKPLNLDPLLSSTTVVSSIPGVEPTWAVITKNKMSEGFYTNGNAAAFVAQSSDAVVIAFRGTNDNAEQHSPNENDKDKENLIHPDKDQWGIVHPTQDMTDHYALFNPLLIALEKYVDDNPGIKNVYVTGHSLGGAMAINYLNNHLDDPKYQGITFAAPAFAAGGLKNFDENNRLLQIEIDKDPVPAAWAPSLGVPRPGDLIKFVGDQTLDTPDVLGKFNTDNHSMDYYRQITDSIDPTSWSRILAETGDQSVFIGARSGPNFDDISTRYDSEKNEYYYDTDFIVDGYSTTPEEVNFEFDGGNNILDPSLGYDIYYGGRGNDILIGGSDDELMLGGSGNDTLSGFGGEDRLFGDAGDDNLFGDRSSFFSSLTKLYGGLGNDTYFIKFKNDEVIENKDEGNDTVESDISYTLPADVENLTLTSTKKHDATGNERSNILTGNDDKNTLKGMDNIDFLYGNGGADTLIGGQGADHLSGGASSDIFRFESITESGVGVGNRDIIMDFSKGKSFGFFRIGHDQIDLSAIDANSATVGVGKFNFIGSSAFTHVAGELHYFTDSGNTFVEGDINADAVADFQIELTGAFDLVKSHFILV